MLFSSLRRFATLLALCVVTVALCKMAGDEAWMTSNEAWLDAGDAWRAELIPLLLFGMTVSIAYHQELALLLSGGDVAGRGASASGRGCRNIVTLLSASATAIFLLGPNSQPQQVDLCRPVLRRRRRADFDRRRHCWTSQPLELHVAAAKRAGSGLWSIAAGFLMTAACCRSSKRLFGVLTDISLLEIGDIAHPLLQELVRRAPGTYNHSINVASIAEAAAESIGAHGLAGPRRGLFSRHRQDAQAGLFRRESGERRQPARDLLPAMSTLIIIAHIKDGADLARQHHLPQADHRFHSAASRHDAGRVFLSPGQSSRAKPIPNAAEVDESSFRYPGPEAADERSGGDDGGRRGGKRQPGAGRADPGPHRSLGARHRHSSGCSTANSTMRPDAARTATIEDSLVKSLTAVYHGRVKYPDQQTA